MHPSGSSIAASAALGLLVIALSSARASALSCTVDADCGPSSSVCTMNFCIGGICAHADLLGDPCTDFDACTLVEHCFIGCKPVGAKPGCQLLGGDGPGAVPPSRNALGCEVEATRAARALAGELLRCRNRAARAELELTSFDLDACIAEAQARFAARLGRLAGASRCAEATCLVANRTEAANTLAGAAEIAEGLLYCATP